MIAKFLSSIFGSNNARQLKKLRPIVEKINSLESSIRSLTDEQLADKTKYFKEQLEKGRSLDDILPEAFAVVREAAQRKIGQRHFDVQLIGGMVLHSGKIAEMKTGEGKTLTATLPLYLNALLQKGAHLVTVNDYLVRRDAEWMGQIYNALGLSCGALQNSLSDSEKQKIYNCDILYATNNELGFDYLRDNMKFRLQDYVQRDLNYAIIDEVDSILIDEARTPLIISGSSDESSKLYVEANKAIKHLSSKTDYEIDEKAKSAQLTESGNDKIEELFRVENLYAIENVTLLHHVNQALKAHALFKKDVEYVVKDGEVLIVDEFTGRILPGRRYSDGLHQAIEAKEAVEIERETQTLASITLQNYFRIYKKLAGMTGTALTEAEEFHKIYNLDVVSIPTNMPMIRKDQSDLIFLNQDAKYKAIAKDVKERHKNNQPILIGTASIESSEHLSLILRSHGIPHEVLNAKNHAREADIVANAGKPGRVTIATNMAGRGTDIKLEPESVKAGGLYILGTERHESRRIDDQLRGRSGRQGDPGETRFYISLEDNLIRIFAGDTIKKNMERVGMTPDEVIESTFISKTIERSQEKVEKHNFEIRKHLLEYDDVLNQQRKVIYALRREMLEGKNADKLAKDMIYSAIQDITNYYAPKKNITAESSKHILDLTAKMLNISTELVKQQDFAKLKDVDKLKNKLTEFALNHYQNITDQMDASVKNNKLLEEASTWLMLEIIDTAWKYQMSNLDHLKEGIGLRGWGQKNPLIEYKKESFAMFEDMMRQVRVETVGNIFKLNLSQFNKNEMERRREMELNEVTMDKSEETPAIGANLKSKPVAHRNKTRKK